MRIATLAIASLMLGAPAAPAAGQVIKGKVFDARGEPVADASVVLLDERGRIQRGTLSEPDGSYALVCPKDGTFKVRVGGPGLQRWDSPPLRVAKDQVVEFEIRVAREGENVLEAFERRRATQKGTFLTEQDIQSKGGHRFTDVMQRIPGVEVVPLPETNRANPAPFSMDNFTYTNPSGGAVQGFFTVRLFGSRSDARPTGAITRLEELPDCPPVLYVDGRWWGALDKAGDTGPDFRFPPSELRGIEIYLPQQVPDELRSSRDAELCGVIVIWRK